jgi:hypothetical protein
MLTTMTIVQAADIRAVVQTMWSDPLPARFGLIVTDRINAKVSVLVAGRQGVIVQVPGDAWLKLYPLIRAIEKSEGGTLQATFALLITSTEVQLGPTREVTANITEWAEKISAGRGEDRTDKAPPPPPHPTDSAAWVLMPDRHFDPVLIYGAKVKGLNYIGIEDQDGVLAVLDGSVVEGSPVPVGTTREMLKILLGEALATPGIAGMVIEVRTTRCYAVTRAALDAVIITQRRPVRIAVDRAQDIAKSVIAIPSYVRAIAARAEVLNNDKTPIGRMFTFSGFILCWVLGFFLTMMMKRLAVDPIYDFLRTTPGFMIFDSADMAIFLPIAGGLAISLAAVLAWTPTMSQHLAFILAGTQPWVGWLFWSTTLADISVGTRFWLRVGFPDGLPGGYGFAPDLMIAVGITVSMVIIAAVISIGTELIVALLIATGWALRKGAGAAIHDFTLGAVSTVVGIYYGGRDIVAQSKEIVDVRQGNFILGADGDTYEVIEMANDYDQQQVGTW